MPPLSTAPLGICTDSQINLFPMPVGKQMGMSLLFDNIGCKQQLTSDENGTTSLILNSKREFEVRTLHFESGKSLWTWNSQRVFEI